MASDRPNWLRRLLRLFDVRRASPPVAGPLPAKHRAQSPPAASVPSPPPVRPAVPPAAARTAPPQPPPKAQPAKAPAPAPVAPIQEPRDTGRAASDRPAQRPASAQRNRQTLVEPARGFLAPESFAPPADGPSAPDVPLFESPVADDRTEPCRAARRPPVPLLHVFDDGQKTAQVVWIRQTPLVIGRSRGSVCIPHDDLISDPHAEIVWRSDALFLRDLESRHGMFLKVSKARLSVGQEIRIGAGRYRFEEPGQLVELDESGQQRRLVLEGAEVWIGRGAGPGPLSLSEDRTVNPRHARLSRDSAGRWHVVDNNSMNGTWIRMSEIQVKTAAEFLLGEQRFRLELPSAH